MHWGVGGKGGGGCIEYMAFLMRGMDGGLVFDI